MAALYRQPALAPPPVRVPGAAAVFERWPFTKAPPGPAGTPCPGPAMPGGDAGSLAHNGPAPVAVLGVRPLPPPDAPPSTHTPTTTPAASVPSPGAGMAVRNRPPPSPPSPGTPGPDCPIDTDGPGPTLAGGAPPPSPGPFLTPHHMLVIHFPHCLPERRQRATLAWAHTNLRADGVLVVKEFDRQCPEYHRLTPKARAAYDLAFPSVLDTLAVLSGMRCAAERLCQRYGARAGAGPGYRDHRQWRQYLEGCGFMLGAYHYVKHDALNTFYMICTKVSQ